MHKHKINRSDAIIICTIRNPYDRVISSYFWKLKNRKIKYLKFPTDINKDIEYHINEYDTGWTRNHMPNQFRRNLSHNVDVILRLEFLTEDIINFNNKYGLILNYKGERKNKNNYNNNIILSNEVKELIYNHYELDFIEGHYDK